MLTNIYDALADAAAEREFRRFWSVIKGWVRECSECGRYEDWLMEGGERICHGCGASSGGTGETERHE